MNMHENHVTGPGAARRLVPAGVLIAGLLVAPAAGQEPPDSIRTAPASCVISTGVTGRVTASGLGDPQYVLSFEPVQRLVLEASRDGVTIERAREALAGVPPSLRDLLELGLLREEGGTLRLGYLLMTVEDQRAVYRVAREYGRDLAAEFVERTASFSRILETRPAPDRDELLFGLVAGMVLNWEGLKVTAEAGYRATPGRGALPYLVHSTECGADLSTEGLYWGSHSFPGEAMTFSTFGDGESLPRVRGIPDALTIPVEAGMDRLEREPAVYAAVRNTLVAHLSVAMNEAGAVMRLLGRASRRPRPAIAERLAIPEQRLDAALGLLEATGYVARDGGDYRSAVPVLTEGDSAIVDRTVALGRQIITRWLDENYTPIRSELSGIPVMQSGIPYPLVFGEVWHYLFGFASSRLAESGFYLDPRAGGHGFRGYVPLVWASALYDPPAG